MKCPKCNTENLVGANFCSNCGTLLPGGTDIIYENQQLKLTSDSYLKLYLDSLPQMYRVIVNLSYCYHLEGNILVSNWKWWYGKDQTPDIYCISAYYDNYNVLDNYGLTRGGWLKMSDLVKI